MDFIDLNKLNAFIFRDNEEEPIAFITLSQGLVGYLHAIVKTILLAPAVQAILRIDQETTDSEEVGESIFLIALQFIVTHEVGHELLGHTAEDATWFEFSGEPPKEKENEKILASHAKELAADYYGMTDLSFNTFEGSFSDVISNPTASQAADRDDQLARLIMVAVTGVMLLYLHEYPDEPLVLSGTHPPIGLRLQELLNHLAASMGKAGKNPSAVTGGNGPELVRAVVAAVPEEVKARWQRQVDFMLEPATATYIKELEDYRARRAETCQS